MARGQSCSVLLLPSAYSHVLEEAAEYTLIRGVRDDIQYITDELGSMQAFLNRLKRAPADHDEQRLDWMKQVREVSYDIKDCVDDVDHRLSGEPRGSGTMTYLHKKWYLLTMLHARHCIATEFGNLKHRAQQVSERPTRPPSATSPAVGIEDAMEKLKPWFNDGAQDTAEPQLKFLAIVGLVALARPRLPWRCTKFHLLTVLRSIIRQLNEQQSDPSKTDFEGIEEWGLDKLKDKLANQLLQQRYLILMDDIWSVSAWENIRDSFPSNGKGRIVVTTRFKSVVEACRRPQGYVHEHHALLEEDSCKLFYQAISSIGYGICHSKPIDGGIIMKICGRLPLAIILVAGLVASKLKSNTDQEVHSHLVDVDKDLSQVLVNNLTTDGVTHILNHCYHHLPADLKTCLLYLSMFPKGCMISRKSLIRRWIAEGFIAEKHGKNVEEVAADCFNELISRNLVCAVNNSSNGKVKSCQIHDMVLEYIVAKSSDENFITIVGGHWQTPFPTYKVRRLSVHKSDRKEKETVERMKLSHVRSLTALGSFRTLHSTWLRFQILQVLDLEGCKDLSFHHLKKICQMHQLKYLSLRRSDIEMIPKKIGKLEYLEEEEQGKEAEIVPAAPDPDPQQQHEEERDVMAHPDSAKQHSASEEVEAKIKELLRVAQALRARISQLLGPAGRHGVATLDGTA
ncbi:unnamed protein product [Miscanthus lutarioriparius]|uniref:Uncharacterized protein n=1 Tax=Miscanthus lutarioriparius TaxID=422564 RepID=A0A811QHU7_9POAL|nr:unnamed protein product [Miscanthus lutarioriparius]